MSSEIHPDDQVLIMPPKELVGPEVPALPSSELDLDDLKQQIIEGHNSVKVLLTASTLRAIHVGLLLGEAKKKLRHGQFNAWIEEQIPSISVRTSQRYMALAKQRKTLVERIRNFFAESPNEPLTADQAESVLAEMKMEDAVALLKWSGEDGTSPRKKSTSVPKQRRLPERILRAVLEFFEHGVDLDPCAPQADADDPPLIPATRRYHGTEGLIATSPWAGRTFLFPPTGKALDPWIRRAVHEYEQERVVEVLLLIPEQPKAEWNELLDDFPRVVLRPQQTTDDAEPGGMSTPHLLVALIPAERLDAFQRVTAVCGPCFVPVSFA